MKIKNCFLTFMALFLIGCSSGNNLSNFNDANDSSYTETISNSAMTTEVEQTSEPIEAPEECVYKGIKYKKDDTAYSVIGYTDVIESNSVIESEIYNLPVTKIENDAFYQCYTLSSIEIPDSVTSIGQQSFGYCISLSSIVISSNVTSIGDYAFFNCELLTSIELPSGLISMGISVFSACSSLEYNEYDNAYYLGNSENPYLVLVKAKDTSITSCVINKDTRCIADGAFKHCDSLENIYYGGTIEDWCNITFNSLDSNPMYYAEHFYMLDDNNEWYEVTSIEISNTVTSIGAYQFCGFENITSITIPSSVTSIGYGAFYGCSSLTIYCEADSQPSGWESNWNSSNCPVVWGYEGE